MGRICAWCGAVLRRNASAGSPVSHALCGGCLEELRAALATAQLRIREP